jgi:hypothetical protein
MTEKWWENEVLKADYSRINHTQIEAQLTFYIYIYLDYGGALPYQLSEVLNSCHSY